MPAINTTTIIKKMLQDSLEREQQIQKNKEEAVQEFNRRFPIGTLICTHYKRTDVSLWTYGLVLSRAEKSDEQEEYAVFCCLTINFNPKPFINAEWKCYGNGYIVERVLEEEFFMTLNSRYEKRLKEDIEKIRDAKLNLKENKKILRDFQKTFKEAMSLAKEKFEHEKYNEYGKDYGKTDAT